MGFSRHEYWSGLPLPPPGDLPDPGLKAVFPALPGRFFTTALPGKPCIWLVLLICLLKDKTAVANTVVLAVFL